MLKTPPTFEGGNYLIMEAKEDMLVTRVFGGQSGKESSFFGFTTPSSSAEAEGMYSLNLYGNNASQMTTVTRAIRKPPGSAS